jgi:K+-transporting ATPase ATPase C chain
VKYANGPKKGQFVGPDIESWFQKDQFDGKPGIVAQWAALHSASAQNWVKADNLNAEYLATWWNAHAEDVAAWIKANPNTPKPEPEDLAVPFFTSYSKTHPGTFPSAIGRKTADGRTENVIAPVSDGMDIQATFFEMWLEAHPGVGLQQIPADMVMASGSGLDPHITLDNAFWQLDRVAAAWAKKTGTDEKELHPQIEQILREKSHSPLGGLVGVPLVNVLEANLALQDAYQKSDEGSE